MMQLHIFDQSEIKTENGLSPYDIGIILYEILPGESKRFRIVCAMYLSYGEGPVPVLTSDRKLEI